MEYRNGFIKEAAIVYILWLLGIILANSLMAEPETYRIGNIIYLTAVVISSILLPLKLCKKRGIKLIFFPEKVRIKGIVSSLILFAIMAGFGVMSLRDYGLTAGDIFRKELWYHLSFILLFLCTMTGYTILWFGYFYQGFLHYSGENRKGRIISIVVSSALYSGYHFTSLIDQYASVSEMFSTMFFTLIIGILIGAHLIFEKSLITVFIAMYIINFFVFFPKEEYHHGFFQSMESPIILLFICGTAFLYSHSGEANKT